jgi:hypothetical protein
VETVDEDEEHSNNDDNSSIGSSVTILGEETETAILLATSVPVVTPGSLLNYQSAIVSRD